MFLEIHAETIVTHECRRTGEQIEDQRHATTYRVELAQLAGMLKPLAELIVAPPEKTHGQNGNGFHRVTVRD